MEEYWKDIKGYEGYYKISSFGRLMTVDRYVENKNPRLYGRNRHIKTRILNLNPNKQGYIQVILSKDKKKKCFLVHRLVALEFLINNNNYPCVNHIDENKTNNNVLNLEWCNYEYNNNFGKLEKKTKKTRNTNIYQLSKDGKLIKIWNSIDEISSETDNKKHGILRCCNGGRKTYRKFIWRYYEL